MSKRRRFTLVIGDGRTPEILDESATVNDILEAVYDLQEEVSTISCLIEDLYARTAEAYAMGRKEASLCMEKDSVDDDVRF